MPPPWSIYLWPTVFCQANTQRRLQFVHLGTRITRGGPHGERLAGQTMWCERTRKREAGLLWDWAEIQHGVVAMVDPMGVLTNLRLVSDAGDVLSAPESALHLSQLVRQLPWQDEVWRTVCQA
ncbi:MAG TPA: hypothetical protein VLA61_15340 [Ideonella sp.]|nr:hypothetical protein [Ideonella sp.]